MTAMPWARPRGRRRGVVAPPMPPDWERLCRESVRQDVGARVAPAHRPRAVVVAVLVPVGVMPSH